MEYPAETAVTEAVVARVKQLRADARLSGAALADGMGKLGFRWNQSTVAKLEAGRRRSISVDELLALAVVLDVPPIWLLVDPKAGRAVPIADGIEVDPWSALAWMAGLNPLDETSDGPASLAYRAIYQLNTLIRLLEQYRMFRKMLDMPMVLAHGDQVVAEPGTTTLIADDIGEARRQTEETAAQILRRIADRLGQFRALQLPVPEMSADVRKHAAELGIELPGQEG